MIEGERYQKNFQSVRSAISYDKAEEARWTISERQKTVSNGRVTPVQ